MKALNFINIDYKKISTKMRNEVIESGAIEKYTMLKMNIKK
jgi:hypothetical protein